MSTSSDGEAGVVTVQDETVDRSMEEPPVKKAALQHLLGDIFVTRVERARSLRERVEDELACYRNEPSAPLEASVLSWWKEHCKSYPVMSKLAKVCFWPHPGTLQTQARVQASAR